MATVTAVAVSGAPAVTGVNANIAPIHTPPIATLPSSVLTQFLKLDTVTLRYLAAVNRFKDARLQLYTAEQSFVKFKSICATQGIVKSLQLKIVERSLIPIIDGLPNYFFSDTVEILKQLEKEMTAKIVETLISAKEKHIKYLREHCNQHNFTLNETSDYDKFVKEYANSYITRTGTDESYFPIREAVHDFNKYLNEQIQPMILQEITTEQQRNEKQQQDAIDVAKAQENVLAGATTGQTITLLASRAVNQRMSELQKNIQRLQVDKEQRKKFFPPDVESNSPSNNSLQSNKKRSMLPKHNALGKKQRSDIIQDYTKYQRKHGNNPNQQINLNLN